MITLEDLQKVELRVGTVVASERVEGSDKLLKLAVDLGGEQRQIVSGIGKVYSPEQLVGRQVVIVTNLGPRTLMGLESQGMIVAAHGTDGPVLVMPDTAVPAGALLS